MKLLYTPNSPYSRVTRVMALEHEIQLDFIEVKVRDEVEELLIYNPAAKVPSLCLDDGIVLSETRIICEYFESMVGSGFLAAHNLLRERHWEGLICGFVDGVAVLVRELRRKEADQSVDIIKLETTRYERCLNHFEQSWEGNYQVLNFAATMLVAGIELIDTRVSRDWRIRNIGLASWFDQISKQNSLRITAPGSA